MEFKVIQDTGYGLVPKRIMRDKNLSAEAKAIYSYLASFAGNTGQAFPSTSLMSSEMNMSRNRLFKYLKELRDKKAISVKREKGQKGQFGRNVYYLHNSLEKDEPCIQNPYMDNPDMDNPDMDNPDMENKDTNSNSMNSNSFKSNSSKSNNEVSDIITQNEKEFIIEEWNKLNLQQLRSINNSTKRYQMLKARKKQYGLKEIIEAIRRIKKSSFLQGQNNRNWTITFDWFIKPNNFIKVLEGNYDDFENKQSSNKNFNTNKRNINKKTGFHNFKQRSDLYSDEELEEIVRRKREEQIRKLKGLD